MQFVRTLFLHFEVFLPYYKAFPVSIEEAAKAGKF